MTTIVSALLTHVNGYRNLEKYIELGKRLLEIPVNKVIFIEKSVFDTYFADCPTRNTQFCFIEKKDLYFYEYMDAMTEFEVNTSNPRKDTMEYMFVQCNKTEWIKKTIEWNPFHTDQFVWLDFGIYHIMKEHEAHFSNYITAICEKKYDRVRIASSLHGLPEGQDTYKNINWFFMGGVFGGHKDALLLFADAMKEKCLCIMKNLHTISWEVNIWFMLYKETPDLFQTYYCPNHNQILLKDY